MSGTCTSGIDRAQSSGDGSDGDKSKGITTSARGNDLSDNESNASDGDDVKMSNIDSSMIKKTFCKVSERLEQAGSDTVGYITHANKELDKTRRGQDRGKRAIMGRAPFTEGHLN